MNKWIILLCGVLVACSNSQTKTVKEESFYQIELSSLLDKGAAQKISLDKWSKKIHYIPLETNDSIQIKSINKIILDNDKLLIVHSDRISLFNLDGKYLYDIGRKGEGIKEYFRLYNLILRNDTIFVNEGYDLKQYNWTGTYLGKMQIPHIRHMLDLYPLSNSNVFLGYIDNFTGQKDKLDMLKYFNGKSFIIKFIFTKNLPSFCIPRADHFSFGITPVINLFETSTVPMKNDINKDGFRLSISKTYDKYYNILEVISVFSSTSVRGKRYLKNYNNFERFEFLREDDMPDFFTTSRKKDINGDEYTYLTLYDSSILMSNDHETISVNALCCNGTLPEELQIGDINRFDNQNISTTNITLPTKLYKAAVDGTILWKLVSVLSLNYQTMTNRTSFLAVLHAYDFTLGKNDNVSEKLRDAVKNIKSKTVYRMINGIPKKGTLCIIDIDDSLFYCIGEVYRLGLILAKFFSSFASINSFCELQINCITANTVLDYFPTEGRKSNI